MRPQNVAAYLKPRPQVEALTSHTRAFAHAAYAFLGISVMVPNGCTQVTHTSELGQMGRFSLHRPILTYRRHITCRTASRASWPSVWLHSLQLAPSRQKKSSWSLSPSPSAKSRSTPVSTSNPFAGCTGQAVRPVPTRKARAGHDADPTRDAIAGPTRPTSYFAYVRKSDGCGHKVSRFQSSQMPPLVRARTGGVAGAAC